MGDFNASFGERTGDTRPIGPRDRVATLALCCARLGHQLVLPERDEEWIPTPYDHIFGVPDKVTSRSCLAPITTDHPLIICEISSDSCTQSQARSTDEVRRFHLKRLDCENNRTQLTLTMS